MLRGVQRRGALALLAVPMGALLARRARADEKRADDKPATGSPVSFEIWRQVSALGQAYSDCVDRLDFEGLQRIFTPDATYDYAPGAVKVGRAAISDFLRGALVTQARTIHFVGAPAVSPGTDPGTYTAWASVMARHEGRNGDSHTVYGRYLDTLQPDPASGTLLIARRRVVTQIAEGVGSNNPRYWLDRGA